MCLKEVTASGLMIYIYSGFNLSHFLDQNGKDQYTTKHVFQLDWLDQWMMQLI